MATVTLAGLQGAPEYLYHYTSIHAVDGILKNRVVWASVLHFLNDSKEWKHAIELAQDQLLKLQGKRPDDRFWDLLIGDLRAGLFKLDFGPCVFSLSAMPNQLSQWRGYCPAQGGYAIRFRTADLKHQLQAQGFHITPCKYDLDIQVKLIERALSSVLEKVPAFPYRDGVTDTTKLGEILHSTRSELVKKIGAIAPALKHPDFQEEAEWRAVRFVGPDNDAMGYHLKGAVAVPHYELRLDAVSGTFPIDEITVGPGPHQELARRGLASIAAKANVRINVSQTPLRHI